MTLRKSLKLWGTEGVPIFFFLAPNFFSSFLLPSPKAVVSKMDAGGTAAPEGEGYPAEGGCFASNPKHDTSLEKKQIREGKHDWKIPQLF